MSAVIKRPEFLERYALIDSVDSTPRVQSVIAINEPHAIADGPLAGAAIAIKDNIECAGLPGSAGSLALIDSPATRDARLVTLLKAAGADIVAATNLSEWANLRSDHSTSGWSAVGGLTANPWALDRSAGGSSSGSGAAVAAGLVSIAIGTETDGSIVCPASLNGVVGLKPTVGSVSTHGIVPISSSQDTPGPIAISVTYAAQTFEILSGRSGIATVASEYESIVRPMRIGIAQNWLTGHAATDAVFESILSKVESVVTSVSTSLVPALSAEAGEDEYFVLLNDMLDDMAEYLHGRLGAGHSLNSLQAIVDFNLNHADKELQHFGQEHFDLAVKALGKKSEKYQEIRARNLAWAVNECFSPAFEKHDLLISSIYGPAWKSDLVLGDHYLGGAATSPAAIAGYPLLTIPMGLVDGLPVGLGISGPANSEPQMLALAAALEPLLGCTPADGFAPQFVGPERG
jgi:amidase